MRTIALIVAAALLAACGSSDGSTSSPSKAKASEPIPLSKIDRAAWTAAIHSAVPDSLASPDLESLYKTTVDDCTQSVDDLTLQMTLQGAQPELVRVDMMQVCPSRAGNLDKALAAVEKLTSETDVLCSSDRSTLTGDDADKYDAICLE